MDTNVLFNGVSQAAITRLKNALTAANTGFFDRIYNTSKNWPSKYFIKIGLIGYNQSVTSFQDLIDLALPGSLANLKNTVKNYSTGFETNTLTALNKAEETLAKISDVSVEKIIILMSDGIPGVDGWENSDPSCYNILPPEPPSCLCGGIYPDACTAPFTCPTGSRQLGCSERTCWRPTCQCGGEYPDGCIAPAPCPAGQEQGGCDRSDCYTPIHSSFNNLIKIKRFFSRLLGINSAEAITEQSKCKFQYCAQAFPNFTCQSNQQMTCRYNQKYDCDLSSDVDIEAKALKDSGISLYTIYYNTSGSLVPKQKMCDWSSNNGANCDNNTYSFAGTDIDAMISRVLGRVVTKPKDIIVGSSPIVDSEPTQTTSTVSGATISDLSCGTINPTVTFANTGYLEFSNLEINYCPAKLHP